VVEHIDEPRQEEVCFAAPSREPMRSGWHAVPTPRLGFNAYMAMARDIAPHQKYRVKPMAR
jgi:hypothetical protein